ncbi:Spore photoproduct lyase [Dissulfuribacter thermophilus]|uniref:Spore photoproduct lyase n=1 Tax=Dissulfuribacter thermophilus TaxID=1156395 RepID=A0A1B9F334_9BACT|nr:hypothetical protein [Dissulfuribacter thermophilus]OCC14347.1 Spore photoproduct lyase [Dissulfuribacter thermophilus]
MIVIICALYKEAAPLVKALGLRSSENWGRFKVYASDDILLGVTGVGSLASAIFTSKLLERLDGTVDFLINVGSCGVTPIGQERFAIGDLILCHTVSGIMGKRTFHPDIFFQHPFQEGSLISSIQPVAKGGESPFKFHDLVDMEAYGMLSASEYFLPPSRTHVLKVVLDALSPSSVTGDQLTRLIEDRVRELFVFLENIRCVLSKMPFQKNLGEEIKGPFTSIIHKAEELGFSKTMISQLKGLLRYGQLNDTAKRYIIETFEAESIESLRSKRLQKRLLRELKDRLQTIPIILSSN